MNILQLDLSNKNHVRDFLSLPFFIYRDMPQWVPPLQMDERLRLDPKRFPFYKHSQAGFFLAYKRSSPADEGTRPIGRLAVLDNRRYDEFNREATALQFSYVVITHIFYARQSQRESKTSATNFTNFHGLGFKNPRTLVKFAAKCF